VVDVVGLFSILLDEEKVPMFEEFMLLSGGGPYPCGDWNGF
jgi:hypothetical protein